ncbi:hypothetical protein [Aureimonas sp. AU40]|uniref:hypothetical protein n=1 Tax=Aureimonas sp. AU40 TaxID=1637747 RepID=UPI000782854A|nr:hypothetical protein [Aureimonas sp. AU40]
MVEKHTVHLRNGGKVVMEGDRCEIHLAGPIVVHRRHWIRLLSPREEVDRTLSYGESRGVEAALEEAFTAVPMTVYPDD